MNYSFPASKILLGFGLGLLLVGCGPTKVAQCNKLSQTFQKGVQLGNKFQQEGQTFQTRMQTASKEQRLKGFKSAIADTSKSFRGLITEWDQLTKEVSDVPLQDEKLVGMQKQYVTAFAQSSDNLKKMVGALEKMGSFDGTRAGAEKLKGNLDEMQGAYTSLNKLSTDIKQVDQEFKSYCTGS